MEKQVSKPKLRFPEFEGEWEKNKFSEHIKLYRGSSPRPINLFITKESNGVNWIKIGDTKNCKNFLIDNVEEKITFEGAKKSRKVFKGELILANSMSFGKTYLLDLEGCIYDGWFVLREFEQHFNREYLHQLLNSNYLQKQYKTLSTGGVVQNISSEIVYDTFLLKPCIKEQTKIASFLTAVDDKLQALKKKKTLLEQYKKGVMQKIFSQELRFKDENGNDYPDWEEKKLGDIGETYNGLTGKSKEHFGDGKPYIQYKQIFDDSKIDISRFELVQISPTENQNKVVFGDVFFTVSSETPNEIGTASVLLDDIEELYLNSFCFGYRASNLYLSPYFSRYLFRNELFRNQIIKLAQGSTRFNMSKVQLMKLTVKLPCVEEQSKIANFLSAIDDKINAVEIQIEKMEVWKKGLLQQLFC